MFKPYFPAAVIGMSVALICQLPCGADIDAKLIDPYVQKEFQWAMFIDTQEDKPYLNYRSSRLNPITQVRVTASSFQQGKTNTPVITPAQTYEEFWYHEEVPIGMRRYRTLDIKPNQTGAIFLGSRGDNSAAAANVLVRLAVELDLQELAPSLVEVPLDKYDVIASVLGRYSFFPRISKGGRQCSIHLRSHPYNKLKDEYFYLQN
ncbi:hypothetical protein BH10CYA1_BH10CYA1_54070 [soil metagenome]